ncbi:hypothetical protein GQ53DRAFT_817851 [Thozetella sp. PMI_491]|nr:hypothetical protein GQ53DRAFT_817851 [Thozetella sp. PMI_491]
MRWTLIALFLGAAEALAHPRHHPSHLFSSKNSTSIWNSSISTNSSDVTVIGVTKTVTVCPTATSSGDDYDFPYGKVGPLATLTPAVPHDHDWNDIDHLSPHDVGTGAPLHYSTPSEQGAGGIYAVAIPRWSLPSIVLDHSGFILSIQVDQSGHLVVTFNDKDAFNHSSTVWAAQELVFVTYTENCGDYNLGQRCYFHATEVIFFADSLTARCVGQAMPLEDIVIDINVAWGNYGHQEINQGAPASTGASTTPSATANAAATTATGDYNVYPAPTARCVAPVDTKYGLPTACWGPEFDDDLDDGLGYPDLSSFSFSDIVKNIQIDPAQLAKRDLISLVKTGFNRATESTKQVVQNVHKTGTETMAKTKDKVVQTIDRGVQKAVALKDTVVTNFQEAKKLATDILEGKPITYSSEVDKEKLLLPRPKKECNEAKNDKEKSKKLKNACKPKTESKAAAIESPWGDKALLLKTFGDPAEYKKQHPKGSKKQTKLASAGFLNFYCVDCGVTGILKAKGNVTIDLKNGITAGIIDGTMDLKASVNLGIFASYESKAKFEQNLYDVPLSPFTLGFIHVGPILSIGTSLEFGVNMTGSALAGVEATLVRANFTYDFKKGGDIQTSGFVPDWTPKFNASGSVRAWVDFGMPIGLEFGLSVGNGCDFCKGTIGIDTVPSIKAQAAFSYEAGYDPVTKNFTKGIKPVNNCSGISTTLSVRNDVNAKIKGFGYKNKAVLHQTKDYIIASYCIGNKTDNTTSGRIGWLGPAEEKRSALLIDGPARDRLSYDFSRRALTNTTSVNATSVNATSGVATNGSTVHTYDLTGYVVSDDIDLGYDGHKYPVTPWLMEDFDGYWYSTVEVNTGSNGGDKYILVSCNDGNIYVQKESALSQLPWYITCTALWSGYQDTVMSAPTGDILHYYNNTMDKVGVSRLRTADNQHLPDSSVWIMLAPFQYDDMDSSLLAATDASGNVFFPAVCTYKGNQTAHVFLVGEDIEGGLAMLKSSDVAYSITNGEVDDCYMLSLSVTQPDAGAWADLDVAFDAEYESDPVMLELNDSLWSAEDYLVLPDSLLVPDDPALGDLDYLFDDKVFDDYALQDDESGK